MTEKQLAAFGFAGSNLLWDEIKLVLGQLQEDEALRAISSEVSGEQRAHQCGRADGITYIVGVLSGLRAEARRVNGLGPEEE